MSTVFIIFLIFYNFITLFLCVMHKRSSTRPVYISCVAAAFFRMPFETRYRLSSFSVHNTRLIEKKSGERLFLVFLLTLLKFICLFFLFPNAVLMRIPFGSGFPIQSYRLSAYRSVNVTHSVCSHLHAAAPEISTCSA